MQTSIPRREESWAEKYKVGQILVDYCQNVGIILGIYKERFYPYITRWNNTDHSMDYALSLSEVNDYVHNFRSLNDTI